MKTLTAEQIEQKKQQLKKLDAEAKKYSTMCREEDCFLVFLLTGLLTSLVQVVNDLPRDRF